MASGGPFMPPCLLTKSEWLSWMALLLFDTRRYQSWFLASDLGQWILILLHPPLCFKHLSLKKINSLEIIKIIMHIIKMHPLTWVLTLLFTLKWPPQSRCKTFLSPQTFLPFLVVAVVHSFHSVGCIGIHSFIYSWTFGLFSVLTYYKWRCYEHSNTWFWTQIL